MKYIDNKFYANLKGYTNESDITFKQASERKEQLELENFKIYSEKIKNEYAPLLNKLDLRIGGLAERIASTLITLVDRKEGLIKISYSAILRDFDNTHGNFEAAISENIIKLTPQHKEAIEYIRSAIKNTFYNKNDEELNQAWSNPFSHGR